MTSYNQRYKKGEGEEIGPGFASVETKRDKMIVKRLHVSGSSDGVVQRKLYALMTQGLVGGRRLEGLRAVRGKELGELCGYEYMPSTVDLFGRELKYLGMGSTMWEVHACKAVELTKRWDPKDGTTVVYADGTNKPVWTQKFSESSKVSSNGRVMPAVEQVAMHSSLGVALIQVS